MVKFILSEDNSKVEPFCKLSLKRTDGGDVSLFGEGSNGINWHLITFYNDGSMILHSSVGEDLGLDLDEEKRLKLYKEW